MIVVANTKAQHLQCLKNRVNYHLFIGIKAQEAGTAIKGTVASGGYSYTGDDGQVYSVTYTADENGFRATGAHLPTPPPIPKEIAEALEKNARDEANGINDDGKFLSILMIIALSG